MAGWTDLYRAQHRELVAVAANLARLLDPERLRSGSDEARRLLRHLAGKLTVHLGMEDRSVYPELLRSQDARLLESARRLQAEMGGLRLAAQDFFMAWLGPDAIARNPGAFIAAARPFLQALAARVALEDDELYSRVEAVGP